MEGGELWGGGRPGELSTLGASTAEEVTEVLLVQVGPEQTGVGVGGLLYGWTLGDRGTRVVVGR